MRYVTPPLTPVARAVLWTIILVSGVLDHHDWLVVLAAGVLGCLAGAAARRARRAGNDPVSVKRLDVRAGDTLVLSVPHPLDEAAVQLLRAQLVEAFPGHRAIVLDRGMTLTAGGQDQEPGPVRPSPMWTWPWWRRAEADSLRRPAP